MNAAAWNVVTALALLTLAPAPVSASATPAPQTVVDQTKEGAEKTKDAVVPSRRGPAAAVGIPLAVSAVSGCVPV
jgi:hypothetical protein